ncbi:MAG: 1-acyl-sn-glycerol-3-phosphate acyltransferase [Candidatus Melainabacteria bacterium]
MLTFDPPQLTRANTLDFKPPRPCHWFQNLFHLAMPLLNRHVFGRLSVQVDPDSLARLEGIRGERCLLLPNHPSEWDPCVLFEVGRRLQEHFFFVAAREVFDYSLGFRGWLFQRLGVYSLVRGSNDRKSLKTSMDILAENRGRLVIFIEGEISNQNETLLPLESGVVQLAFMALQDCYKDAGKDLAKLPSLYVCPVGLRYVYNRTGLAATLARSMRALETATGIANPATTRVDRMHALARVILDSSALQMGFELPPEAPMGEQIGALSDFMLSKLEGVINLPPDAALSRLDRVRRIRNTVDAILTCTLTRESSAYAQRLYLHQKAVLKNFHHDLDRVVNFIAIYDGYLTPEMTEEQTVSLIRRMEKEVFGHCRTVHPRTAVVSVAEPINLRDHFEAYLADKRATVRTLTAHVERDLAGAVQDMTKPAPQNPLLSGEGGPAEGGAG